MGDSWILAIGVPNSLASPICFWFSSSRVRRLGDLLFSGSPSDCIGLFWRAATWAKSYWLSSLNLSCSWCSRGRGPSILVRGLIEPVVPSYALLSRRAFRWTDPRTVVGTGLRWWAPIVMRSPCLRWHAIDRRLVEGLCPQHSIAFALDDAPLVAYLLGAIIHVWDFLEDGFSVGEI